MKIYLFFFLNLCNVAAAWYRCPLNRPGSEVLSDNVTIVAECMYLTSPLEWYNFNPNTFNGSHYNRTREISVIQLHVKRLFLSTASSASNVTGKQHIINYWLVNGGGGSQVGMESFGISTLKQIVANRYDRIYPETFPVMYLFQYRGAGMTQPSIHCYTAKNWIDCAKELINTTHPSKDQSLRIINAMSNQHIAQDLQYQIQYAMNESQSIARTSTYIYGLSQGTGILQYYLSIQSIDQQLQQIDGIILDGIMAIEHSDVFHNQMKSINDRFYLYLSKCEADTLCSKAFHLVVGTDHDILSVALKLQMLFLTNMTDTRCTTQLGLTSWDLFTVIINQGIESIFVRPIIAILIARVSRCSTEDQRVLGHLIPTLIDKAREETNDTLTDPPEAYPDDGNVLSITTIWSDFTGFTLQENFKTNREYYNDFCTKNQVVNEFYLSPTGTFPICAITRLSERNYTLPKEFQDILYEKNPQYWGKFRVNRNIFRSLSGGALLLNGDLDYNSPLYSAEQVKKKLDLEGVSTRLINMKGLAHVTIVQSYTKKGGFQSTTCTDQIVAQYLYHDELNLNLSTIDVTCSSPENLIGIDWFASEPTINKTLYGLFARSTTDYWGINMTNNDSSAATTPTYNHANFLETSSLTIIFLMTNAMTFLFLL